MAYTPPTIMQQAIDAIKEMAKNSPEDLKKIVEYLDWQRNNPGTPAIASSPGSPGYSKAEYNHLMGLNKMIGGEGGQGHALFKILRESPQLMAVLKAGANAAEFVGDLAGKKAKALAAILSIVGGAANASTGNPDKGKLEQFMNAAAAFLMPPAVDALQGAGAHLTSLKAGGHEAAERILENLKNADKLSTSIVGKLDNYTVGGKPISIDGKNPITEADLKDPKKRQQVYAVIQGMANDPSLSPERRQELKDIANDIRQNNTLRLNAEREGTTLPPAKAEGSSPLVAQAVDALNAAKRDGVPQQVVAASSPATQASARVVEQAMAM